MQSSQPPTAHLNTVRLADLSPSYFGFVMATGITAIASHLVSIPIIPNLLFAISAVAFVILWFLFVLRAIRYPHLFFDDMKSHLRGPGFFTVVAGTGILGSEYILLEKNLWMGTLLFIATAVLWILTSYGLFAVLMINSKKPSLSKGISGSWLLAIVATQSLAALCALIAHHYPTFWTELNFIGLSLWLWGGMLYIWLMTLIFYRYMFFSFSLKELSPPYWINMGAMAISTLVGSLLILNASSRPYLDSIHPFLKGFTIFYWAAGTWWIPMLLVLDIWRYLIRRSPLSYTPSFWSLVFPLGMYTACTHQMIAAMHIDFLRFLPIGFIWIALAAWAITFMGLMRFLLRHIRRIQW